MFLGGVLVRRTGYEVLLCGLKLVALEDPKCSASAAKVTAARMAATANVGLMCFVLVRLIFIL